MCPQNQGRIDILHRDNAWVVKINNNEVSDLTRLDGFSTGCQFQGLRWRQNCRILSERSSEGYCHFESFPDILGIVGCRAISSQAQIGTA